MKKMSLLAKIIFSAFFFLFFLFFLLAIKVLDISYPLTITSTTKTSELAVVGEGKIEVVPDTAYVYAGITVNNAETVEKARGAIDEVNNKIIEAMKNLGISQSDIKTSNYSVYPNYSYVNNESKISGYNGNATLTIKVKEVKLATRVVEEATKAGANQIQGTSFVVGEPEKYREEARNKAIENAKSQAEKLARQLGIKLGKIVNLVESTPQNAYYYPQYGAMADVGRGGGGPQFEPGSQTISSTVTLYFEKK